MALSFLRHIALAAQVTLATLAFLGGCTSSPPCAPVPCPPGGLDLQTCTCKSFVGPAFLDAQADAHATADANEEESIDSTAEPLTSRVAEADAGRE